MVIFLFLKIIVMELPFLLNQKDFISSMALRKFDSDILAFDGLFDGLVFDFHAFNC